MKVIDAAVVLLVLLGCAESNAKSSAESSAATSSSDAGDQLPEQMQRTSTADGASDSDVFSDSGALTDSGDPWRCAGSQATQGPMRVSFG